MRIWLSMALMRLGERFSAMAEDYGVEAYYTRHSRDGEETIRIMHGDLTQGQYTDLDIRDAVFLRYQLDGAIQDYEKAVGR